MDDETLNPEVTEESLPQDANGTDTPTQPEQPQFVSRAEWLQWQQEYDAKHQAQIEQVKRDAQRAKDRARENALQKAKAFDADYAKALAKNGISLNADQIAEVKRTIIDDTFWNEPTEPEVSPIREDTPNQAVDEPHIVSRQEIESYLKDAGLAPDAIDIGRYAGLPSNQPGARDAFLQDVENARKAKPPSTAGKVAKQFGNTAPTLGAGRPGNDIANINDPDQLWKIVQQGR